MSSIDQLELCGDDLNMETLDTQVIYKLAQIETKVGELSAQLTSVISRLEQRITDDKIETAKTVAAIKVEVEQERSKLEKRVDANERLLQTLHKWKEGWVVRTTWTLSLLSAVWFLVGDTISEKVKAFLH